MKEPLRTRYAPGYDLFKLIVAVILTAILILLLLRERDERLAALQMAAAALTETVSHVLPTGTALPSPTATPNPPPIEPPAPASPPSQESSSEETSSSEEPPAEAAQEAVDPVAADCPSNPTRLRVGLVVRVLDWLNFRAAPGLGKTILRTNRPGTKLEVIGGPVCTLQAENPPRAYLWWNVRMEDGREGWSAEAPLNFPNYFLEPVEANNP